eukprot:CAMPEP_0194204884 /NCGR_PEP_ID=MMETSP0156-20130528/4296_1 /TAXON_ID=33649 /ORGANISM="Thalassionema nitzschioides, Strain L26-B" /LENGTH=367 /DNA_ID=CAMNT_0038931011 /DNA_START=181 /DNA_END=1284 /DNA_ORIENTATION=+
MEAAFDLDELQLENYYSDALSSADKKWNNMFILLKQFQQREGHCNVPANHEEDGQKLGYWLSRQRQRQRKGVIDVGRKSRLEELEVVWSRSDEKWNNMFTLLQRFQQREGHCNVLFGHKEDGQKLGHWLNNQRQLHKKGVMDVVRKSRLEEVGVVWGLSDDQWHSMFILLKQFQHREGHCKVPLHDEENGQKLGSWLNVQRHLQKKGVLDSERESRLEEIGVVFDPFDDQWNSMFILLKQFQQREGHCNVSSSHEENGQKVGCWLNNQRQSQKKGALNEVRKSRLEEVGVVWDVLDEKWDQMYALLKKFKQREGHCKVPVSYQEDGQKLGSWLNVQRYLQRNGTLDAGRKSRLEQAGVVCRLLKVDS